MHLKKYTKLVLFLSDCAVLTANVSYGVFVIHERPKAVFSEAEEQVPRV